LQQKLGEVAVAKLPTTANATAQAAARLSAFRDATSWVSFVFIGGIVVVYFLPETKRKRMPADADDPR